MTMRIDWNRRTPRSDIFPITRTKRPDDMGVYMILGPLGRHLGDIERVSVRPVEWRVRDADGKSIGGVQPTLEAGIDALIAELQERGLR